MKGRPFRRSRASIALGLILATLGSAGAAGAACGTVVIPSGLGFAGPDAINTLHPLFGNGLEIATSTLLYRPLIAIDNAHTIDWRESLASAVAADTDGRGFLITLKAARWSDGVAVTASDVVYTFGLIRALGPLYEMVGQGGVPDDIRALTAPDPRHVRIRLAHAVNAAWFTATALTQLVPLPAHDWGRFPVATQQSLQSRTSFYRTSDGAFRLRALVLGRDAVFEPNPDYAGPPVPFRRLVIRFFPGGSPLEALRAGEVDAASLPVLLGGPGGFQPDGLARVTLPPSWLDWAIVPNLANRSVPFLRDAVVRAAMARAIDQARLIRVALHGDGVAQHGFVPTAWRAFLPPEERSGASVVDFDPAAANAALDTAGWTEREPDGTRIRNGRALAFTVLVDVDNEPSLLMMQVAQAELAAIGVRMHIEALAFTQLLARAVGPTEGWDAVLFSQPSSPYPDASAALLANSGNNYGRYADPQTDRLIAAATARDDPDALWALERRVEAQQPDIFLPAPGVTVLARPALHGVDRLVDTVGNWRPQRLWLEGCGSG